jgi:ubiquinone/menaquinone biosynthesis C-methylase UbiE
MRVSLTKIALAACVLLASAPAAGAATNAGAALQKRRTSPAAQRRQRPLRRPDVIYVPTPPETVDEMLRQARLKQGDVLFDLGSGDGRIPLAAARQFGVRAVGIDIDPKLVEEATAAAKREGLDDLVSFRLGDMFAADLSGATVVTLYLSDRLNVMLRPKLLRELPVGARIVSHDFRMGDWPPEKSVRVPWKNLYRTVYVWTVPRGRRYKKSSRQ